MKRTSSNLSFVNQYIMGRWHFFTEFQIEFRLRKYLDITIQLVFVNRISLFHPYRLRIYYIEHVVYLDFSLLYIKIYVKILFSRISERKLLSRNIFWEISNPWKLRIYHYLYKLWDSSVCSEYILKWLKQNQIKIYMTMLWTSESSTCKCSDYHNAALILLPYYISKEDI